MPLRAPRFFGDATLEKCLQGELRVSATTGSPAGAVGKIQFALNSSGANPKLNLDGIFGPLTGNAVQNYRISEGIVPTSNKEVDSAMMARLDNQFAFELFDSKAKSANLVPPDHPFYMGSRGSSPRKDLTEGFATCEFAKGTAIEIAHVNVFFLPKRVADAWKAAGSYGGKYGVPLGNPRFIDTNVYVQEFSGAVQIVDLANNKSFALTPDQWKASTVGRRLVGLPTDRDEALPSGIPGRRAPHQNGMVVAVAGRSAQALPATVYDQWVQEYKDMGPPKLSAALSDDNLNPLFVFESNQIPRNGTGTV